MAFPHSCGTPGRRTVPVARQRSNKCKDGGWRQSQGPRWLQVYAHALLNLWTGTRNNYVALFDMDEYMVIDPRGKRVEDLGRECWPDSAEIHLHRQVDRPFGYAYRLPTCRNDWSVLQNNSTRRCRSRRQCHRPHAGVMGPACLRRRRSLSC